MKKEDIKQILLNNYHDLPLIKTSACGATVPVDSGKSLISNYPNPFTESTRISYTTTGDHTLIQIMNTSGQLIATPLDGVIPVAGTYNLTWPSGKMSSGIYYLRLQNGNVQQVKTMLKVK